VLLLAAGVSCGWNLVNYLTVPDAHVRRALTYTVAACVVGLGFSALLGAQAGAAGPALATFAGSALIAYAGNARKVSTIQDPPPHPRPRPSNTADTDPRPRLILVTYDEPERYGGPSVWASRYAMLSTEGESLPHWFVRPLTYARIRRAYRDLAPEETISGVLGRLAGELSVRLEGEYSVLVAFLHGHPSLASTLLSVAEEGTRLIVLLPLGIPSERSDRLREQVLSSRVLEVGVRVEYASCGHALTSLAENARSRLHALARGIAPGPPELPPETLDALVEAVRNRADTHT